MEAPFFWSKTYDNGYAISFQQLFQVPLLSSFEDEFFQFVANQNVPTFAIKEIREAFQRFLDDQTTSYFNDRCSEEDYSFLSDEVIHNVSHLIAEEHSQCLAAISSRPQSEEEVFARHYESVLHSERVTDLIRIETHFNKTIAQNIDARNAALKDMELRHESELNRVLEDPSNLDQNLGNRCIENRVNLLTQDQFEERQLLLSQWHKVLLNLQREQRRDYVQLITSTDLSKWKTDISVLAPLEQQQQHHHNQANGKQRPSAGGGGRDSVASTSPELSSQSSSSSAAHWSGIVREESFTVSMGRQCRSSYNMRIVCASMVDWLCRWQNQSEHVSQRMQCALSLYSRQLSAVVVFVDTQISSVWGVQKELAAECERSAEFHFPPYEKQLKQIRLKFKEIAASMNDSSTVPCCNDGDIYVTSHSGMPCVQLIFHVCVSENTVYASNIRYPSPLHQALRTILKFCYLYDVTTLTLPLLLVHSLRDSTNTAWCVRRMETVLNAVKAAMLEFSKWRGQENKTIQFCLPPELSEEVFESCRSLMTTFFDSTPVIGTRKQGNVSNHV